MPDIKKSRRIPEENRPLFQEPIGKLITDNDLKKITKEHKLIAVGDVVSLTAIKKVGILPDIILYDGMTERREMTEFANFVDDNGWKVETVANPPGIITADIVKAITNALSVPERTVMRVIGEEDLAVIPCILLAPVGTNIIYGWPGKGMMLVTVDERTKKKTEELLNKTEEFQ